MRSSLVLFASPTPSDADANGDAPDKEKELTPAKVAELIEVSFVNGVMQLAQGYVDVLKLFIAAVQAGYSLKLSPESLLEAVDACPEQSANRPLMDEEIKLRTTWIQVVYLVLDHVKYKDVTISDMGNVSDTAIDLAIRDTYGQVIPRLVQAQRDGATFEAEAMLDQCADVLPMATSTLPCPCSRM